jgi:hypothetical protein
MGFHPIDSEEDFNAAMPAMAEDSHLEALYEDRVTGGEEPEAFDADYGYDDPFDEDSF